MTEPADATPGDAATASQAGKSNADGADPTADAPEERDKWDALAKRIAEREKRYTPAQRALARALGFL